MRVRVPSRVPLAVIERGPWAEPPLVTFCENGTAEVQAATCDLDAAARWVLECGTEAEALTPSPLGHRVVAQAKLIRCRHCRTGDALPAELLQQRGPH